MWTNMEHCMFSKTELDKGTYCLYRSFFFNNMPFISICIFLYLNKLLCILIFVCWFSKPDCLVVVYNLSFWVFGQMVFSEVHWVHWVHWVPIYQILNRVLRLAVTWCPLSRDVLRVSFGLLLRLRRCGCQSYRCHPPPPQLMVADP